jgi:low temperature requirement protein LtrA
VNHPDVNSGQVLKPRRLFRHQANDPAAKVTMVELFFDLVFVFAITQLSHLLLASLTPLGGLQTLVLLLAVWSLWNYTAWATNALDPERILVRLLLFALMLTGLVVSVSIPSAFQTGAWSFAIGYVLMHTIRSGFVLWAARDEPLQRRQNFQRNIFWVALSAVFWFAGALAQSEQRLYWWIFAITMEFLGPMLLYWTPGLGSSKTSDWIVDGAHMAERCALFVIIALGESLLITGATFTGKPFATQGALGLTSAFFGTVTMWWIYFNEGAEHAARQITKASDPGKTAVLSYSFIHIAIVAGIIVSAVGNEIVLTHPEHANWAASATVVGGPALFLLGCTLFKWANYQRRSPPLSHSIGLIALCAVVFGTWYFGFSTLTLSLMTTAILIVVAFWETLVLRKA